MSDRPRHYEAVIQVWWGRIGNGTVCGLGGAYTTDYDDLYMTRRKRYVTCKNCLRVIARHERDNVFVYGGREHGRLP